MKKRIKRIAQKSNRKLQEMMGRMEVNLMLPIAEVLTANPGPVADFRGGDFELVADPALQALDDHALLLQAAAARKVQIEKRVRDHHGRRKT